MTMLNLSARHLICLLLVVGLSHSHGHPFADASAIPVESELDGQTDGHKYIDKNELLSVPLDMIDINRFDEGDLDDLQRELKDQQVNDSSANQTTPIISIALVKDANDTLIIGPIKKEELGQRPEFEYRTIKKKN